jgi:hypothetical protein
MPKKFTFHAALSDNVRKKTQQTQKRLTMLHRWHNNHSMFDVERSMFDVHH